MTESDIKTNDDIQSQSKAESLDAIRRHICQILGFDFGFIDIASGHEIDNVASFCFDDEADVAKEFIESLVDEHKQPITVANTLVAQKVKQTQRSWVGKAYALEDVEKGLDEDSEGFPYMIVPVLSNPGARVSEVMGLIRVIAFDAAREITTQDLTTLKLMGEHLASRTGLFGDLADQVANAKQTGVAGDLDNIMIVHSNRLVRRRFNRILGNGYHVIEGESSERALEILEENRVDVILLDSELQGTSGFGFCKVLKETTKWKHIPVILVVTDNSATARVEGLNVGADDCIPDSCLDAELIARIRSSLRHRKSERELSVQLQLLEDYAQRLEKAHEQLSIDRQDTIHRNSQLEILKRDGEVQRHQDNLLHRISNVIRKSFNIRENLEEMLEAISGWFSLDCTFIVMPNDAEPEDTIRVECVSDKAYKVVAYDRDLDIFEIFKKNFQADQSIIANDAASDRRLDPFHKILKSGFSVQSLFFIPITYEQKLQGLLVGYKCEARAAWSRINETFMKAVVDQVAVGVVNARLYATVQRQATTDGLTGLYNHRTGQEKLADQLKQAERYQRRLSVIMLDVDHFKSINDTYGHPAGDSVLKSVARLIRNSCRDVDIPVRYGGEEFLLVLPEITQDGATVVAERIRVALKSETINHEDLEIRITASLGVASFPDDADSQQYLLDLADKSLYLSKRLGRDQVHTAADLLFEPEVVEDKSSEDVAKAVRDGGFSPPVISEEARQHEELVPEVVDMVKSLAASLYAKSDYNKQHHLEVARMSELLAKVMGLSAQQVEQIRVAGLLHDVGVLQLPPGLLEKEGNLTREERDQVNQHATLGAQMLRPVRALKDICEILENHHERWDGTGYPKGLKGEDIPLPARIVAIVDSYHALISERPYRAAMTHDEALKVLKDGAGKQWDPFLIEIFSAVMKSMRETTQEVQAKVAMAATLAKAAAEQNAAALDQKNKNSEAGNQPAQDTTGAKPQEHSHDHPEHSHDPALEYMQKSAQQTDEKKAFETETSDQLFAVGSGTATARSSRGEDLPGENHDLSTGAERSKISSIIGPLIKPVAQKPESANEEASQSGAQQPAHNSSSAAATGSTLPEKTGFAVPAPGPEQTGALASLVRPLTPSTNTAPPDKPPQPAPVEQPAQPSPQSQAINDLLHQQSRQPQDLPPSQSQPRTSQSNPVFQPGQSSNQQPTSQTESAQNQSAPSIYGRPAQDPNQPAQRSPIIPPPNMTGEQSGSQQTPSSVQNAQNQNQPNQKPLGMNPQGVGTPMLGNPSSSQVGLPAQSPGTGSGAGQTVMPPSSVDNAPTGYPRPAVAGQAATADRTDNQSAPSPGPVAPPPPFPGVSPPPSLANSPRQTGQNMQPGLPVATQPGQQSSQIQQPGQGQQPPQAQPPQGFPQGAPPVGMPGSPRQTGHNMQPGQPPTSPVPQHGGQSGHMPTSPNSIQQTHYAQPQPPGSGQPPQVMPVQQQQLPPQQPQLMPGQPTQTPAQQPQVMPVQQQRLPVQQPQAMPGQQQQAPAQQPQAMPGQQQQAPAQQPQAMPAQQQQAPAQQPQAMPGVQPPQGFGQQQQPPQQPQNAGPQPYVPGQPTPTVTGIQNYARGPQIPQTGGQQPPQPNAQTSQPYSVHQQSQQLGQPNQQSQQTPHQQASPSSTTSGTTATPAANPQLGTSRPASQDKQPDTWDPAAYDDEDEIENNL